MSQLHIKGKLFLAPMAGITDVAFRSLCVRYGADVTCTELISANGLVQNNERTKELIARGDNEKQFAIQLFGSKPEIMTKAGRLVADECSMIDINIGCPVPKVVKQGAGSGLLRDVDNASNIVQKMSDELDIPITAKMRIGINKNPYDYVSFAKRLEEAGAQLIMVHGRTQEQGYSGEANWNAITEIKDALTIPVIGNGDIRSPKEVMERMRTNVDGFGIGRGASGNPLLFTQIQETLQGQEREVTQQERVKAFNEYIDLAQEWKTNFIHQKLQAQEFTKGIYNSSKVRLALNDATTPEELRKIVTTCLEEEEQ